jgi:hypothetical protein
MNDILTCRGIVWCFAGIQLSDDDAVAETAVNFNMEKPKNVSTVNQSARGDTGVISVTTAHMRAMYDNFYRGATDGLHAQNQQVSSLCHL